MGDVLVKELIQEKLCNIEQSNNGRILYAAESGSRAWGFASPNSDYDIRFIFARPATAYLGIALLDDTINIMDGDLDFSGWDIRKTFGLLDKGNMTALEWLASPTVYREAPASMADTARAFYQPAGALEHYYGMTRKFYENHLRGKDLWNVKKVLYVLRGLFCCMWIGGDRKAELPPLDFITLARSVCSEDIMETVIRLLEVKAREDESGIINKKELGNLEQFILAQMDHRFLQERVRGEQPPSNSRMLISS
jgi:predicted nucleotidyltransferase